MKKIQRIFTALMVFTLMVGNTAWVVTVLEGNEDALKATPFTRSETTLQDPRPIGLGHGLYK